MGDVGPQEQLGKTRHKDKHGQINEAVWHVTVDGSISQQWHNIYLAPLLRYEECVKLKVYIETFNFTHFFGEK